MCINYIKNKYTSQTYHEKMIIILKEGRNEGRKEDERMDGWMGGWMDGFIFFHSKAR